MSNNLKLSGHPNTELLLEKYGTPLHVFDLTALRNNLQSFRQMLPDCMIYYSTKTNPEPVVIDILRQENVGFDAATLGEITLLLQRSVDPSKILYTHPVKSVEDIQTAHTLGVARFTFDSLKELGKLRQLVPNGKYFLRIAPISNASLYDYGGRFGASSEEVEHILSLDSGQTNNIVGISFHVGSQSLSVQPWQEMFSYVKTLLDKYHDKIPALRIINIGSGFPERYAFENVPSLEEIAEAVNNFRDIIPKDVQLCAEPGRILVASASTMVAQVTDTIQRSDNNWIYTDLSAYSGLIEILESHGKFRYNITSARDNDSKTSFIVAGGTLDPDDIISQSALLPEDTSAGDYLFVHDTGAYTTNFWGGYHELKKPHIVSIDSIFDSRVLVSKSRYATNGVIAQRDFEVNEVLFTVTGHFSKQRTRTSFQVDADLHVEPAILGAYLNHSCNPNAGIRTNRSGFLDIISRRHINAGDEIMVDYAMFEYEVNDMAQVSCACQQFNCRHHITGYKDLPQNLKLEYASYTAAYLLKIPDPANFAPANIAL